jgi:hypothetical protein
MLVSELASSEPIDLARALPGCVAPAAHSRMRRAARWQASCLSIDMNTCLPEPSKPDANHAEDQQISTAGAIDMLEQQMAELGLSCGDKCFLRNFHLVEKQLNDALDETGQCADLVQRVSQVYRQMYRTE